MPTRQMPEKYAMPTDCRDVLFCYRYRVCLAFCDLFRFSLPPALLRLFRSLLLMFTRLRVYIFRASQMPPPTMLIYAFDAVE